MTIVDLPRTESAPTEQTTGRFAANQAAATARIDSLVDALLNLRSLVSERPDIAHAIRLPQGSELQFNLCLSHQDIEDVAGHAAELAHAAQEAGAEVVPHVYGRQAGVIAKFGPFRLYVFASQDELGMTAVREVAEFVLDPRLAAFGSESDR